MYISKPNGGSELRRAFVLNTCSKPSPSHAPYDCKSGIRLTTFPSFRAWTFNFSSSLERLHRLGGVRFSVAQ